MRLRRQKRRTMADRVQPWFAVRGDETLRQEYDLGPDSVVLDVGGFEGQWASDIFGRYVCRILIFEPVPAFAERIAKRFERNSMIEVYPYGLAGTDRSESIAVAGDASSTLTGSAQGVLARFKAAAPLLESLGIGKVDLLKVNIEGGEYELINHLLDERWMPRVANLQVQFHDFVPHAEEHMRAIQNRLSETHALTYQFEFVWENWRLKGC